MIPFTDRVTSAYPSWELLSHNHRRAVMNRVDGLRVESDRSNRIIQNKLDAIRQSVADELKELSILVREEYQSQNHHTASIRCELKHLPVIPVPKTWGIPEYQFGQRVLMTEYNLTGIVTGIDYSDGTVHDAGWHYQVKLDYNPISRDEIESAIESDLRPLGLVNESALTLSDL